VGSVAFAVSQDSWSSIRSLSGSLCAVGRVAGMTGTYLLVVLVVLMSRLPWVERTIGQDRLVRWHRRIGFWPVGLLTVHVTTLVWGYAVSNGVGIWSQIVQFLLHYDGMLMAVVAYLIVVVASVTSYSRVRRHLRYETWWSIHLYLYLAVGLAYLHEVRTGIVFLWHPTPTFVWTFLLVLTALLVAAFRLGAPLWLNLRHHLRVHEVTEVAPDVYGVVVTGRRLDRLPISGGQFFQWRFFAPGMLLHSHPYSISAMPQRRFLRVTIKALGDQSGQVGTLRPGTRALIEGPYGLFTRHAQSSSLVVLIAAGVGATPIRALLEDLSPTTRVTTILRASHADDLVHSTELESLTTARGGTFHALVGSREDVPLTTATLAHLAPDLARSDVYVCGPIGFTRLVGRAARELGVPRRRLHVEGFEF
jgi:predicted ferric reductase